MLMSADDGHTGRTHDGCTLFYKCPKSNDTFFYHVDICVYVIYISFLCGTTADYLSFQSHSHT